WNMRETCLIESTANFRDKTVHHIAWCNSISARLCLRYRSLYKERQGCVIVDIFCNWIDQSAVAVVCIFTQARIQYNEQFRIMLFRQAASFLDDAVIVVGACAFCI